jgi:molybdopterin-containing oxidoreductase family iron-sulfur binding subunit
MITRRRLLHVAGLCALAATTPDAARAAASSAGTGTPAAGPQQRRWAMAVDLERCRRAAGCTDCITACHTAHNVPDMAEPRHRVRWVGRESFRRVFAEQAAWTPDGLADLPVPVLCNQCDNPPCVRVCPTKATWKRDDGIVAMDYHRCIGCRYCIAACPYGARSFNWVDPRRGVRAVNAAFPTRTRGVVEKCNFCEERLAKGERPACVVACRESAMVFGDLNDPTSDVRRLLRTRYTVRRKPELGTGPGVFYVI